MNKMYKLAVVLMKSFGDSVKGKNDKGAKQIKRIAMYVLITVAMLPTAGIGAMAYGMYKGLAPIGQSGLCPWNRNDNSNHDRVFLWNFLCTVGIFIFLKMWNACCPYR